MKYVMLGTQRAWAMMARDDQKLGTFRSEYESSSIQVGILRHVVVVEVTSQ